MQNTAPDLSTLFEENGEIFLLKMFFARGEAGLPDGCMRQMVSQEGKKQY
jgi:hypothetical protein